LRFTLARSEMPKYEVIIYWNQEDEAFIAEVPELSGCAADGKTYREALTNVEIVIQEWIATAKELGPTVPLPKGRRLVFA
jgi:predicted RNase H-like HicB family nuclease